MTIEERSSDEEIFLRKRFAGSKGAWLIAAGVGTVCLGLAGLALAVLGRVGPLRLQAMSTMPVLFGIGMITAGWSILRTPRKVVVNREGLWLETARGQRGVRWDEVGCALLGMAGWKYQSTLYVVDVNGKLIIRIDDSFNMSGRMMLAIIGRVELECDDAAVRFRIRRGRGAAVFGIIFGCVMALGSVFVAWSTRQEQLGERALKQNPVFAQAEIVRKYVAPNGIARRIEYRIQSEGRSATRNVEVDQRLWNASIEGALTPVIHVKGDPGFSRLVRGEVRERDPTKTPIGGFGLAAADGVLSLGLIAAGVLLWNGWDIHIDSNRCKWSIKRFGTLVSKSSLTKWSIKSF